MNKEMLNKTGDPMEGGGRGGANGCNYFCYSGIGLEQCMGVTQST
jgi:hypothetical protein